MGTDFHKLAVGGLAALFIALPVHAEDGAGALIGSIAGPVSSIVVAGIQAGANKAVASINAGAEVKKTEIMAKVQDDANTKAAETEMYRTKTAAEIAGINQSGLTERQAMISMESIIATKEKYTAMREQAWMNYEFGVAQLMQADRNREQQLALEKQYRDLQTAMGILAPTGTNGGLEITRAAQQPLESNATNVATLDSAGAEPTEAIAANSAQNRLTRNLSTTNVGQKIASYRAGKSVVRSTTAPQLVLAANDVKRTTQLVRGSRNSNLLTIASEESPRGQGLLVARAATSKRAALVGAGHGKIGRQSDTDLYRNDSSSGESSSDGDSHGHHHQP